jgi:hypothetical protein
MCLIFLDLLLSFLYIQPISELGLITFKMLSAIIEKTPDRYFSCQEAGPTITELAGDVCRIIKRLALQYKEVKRIK